MMMPFRRALAVLLLLLAMPAPVFALSVMDPFNMPAAMDGGTVKAGDGIAYADGPRHRLDVYAPETRGSSAPVVFFIYGGGWAAGDRFEYDFVGRAFAANGYVAVIPDYRKYPEVVYPDFLSDNASAIKWIEQNIELYGGDTSRFFLAGHSAGAYNSVMLALDGSYLREYGVTMPIRAVAGISGPYNFYPFEYDEVRRAFGDAPNPEGTQPVDNGIRHAGTPVSKTLSFPLRRQFNNVFPAAERDHVCLPSLVLAVRYAVPAPHVNRSARWRPDLSP